MFRKTRPRRVASKSSLVLLNDAQRVRDPRRKNAGPKAGVPERCDWSRLAAVGIAEFFFAVAAVVVTAIVDASVKMVTALAADVMAVGPAAAVPVTGDPDHLVVACPIASAVIIVRPVANFD